MNNSTGFVSIYNFSVRFLPLCVYFLVRQDRSLLMLACLVICVSLVCHGNRLSIHIADETESTLRVDAADTG